MSTQTVSLRLLLTGNAGPELRRIANQQRRDTRTINDMQRLGLRTQRQIRDEIRNQERAYRRLRASGTATANDIRRAQRQLREETRRLNGELRTSGSLMGKMQTAGAIVGGAVAAGAVVNSQIKPAMTYDETLSRTAAGATYKQDISSYKLAKSELTSMVKDAVAYGGGTNEGALNAAAAMVGSGIYDLQSVKPVLANAQRTAFATGSDSADAAKVTTGLKRFGIAENDIGRGQDIAVAAGLLGGFEYDSMARWFSEQLPLARNAGYGGLEGVKKVAAMNQLAMSTASSEDQAGNNIVNMLQKISSREFTKQVSKQIEPRKGDPLDEDGLLDWSQYALNQKSQGVDQVDAFVALLEREMGGNSQYQNLKQQANNATGSDQAALLDQMSRMMEGTAVGEVIADRQALMAMLAVTYGGKEKERLMSGLDVSEGAVDEMYGKLEGEHFATALERQQKQLDINYNLYLKVNDVLGGFNEAMTGFMTNYEELSTAAYGAGVVLGGIAAMGTVGSFLGGTGGGGATGVVKGAAKGGALALAGAGGYTFGSWISERFIENNEKLSDTIGGTIHTALASMGVESSQQALDQHFNSLIQQSEQTATKQDQMVNEQTQTKQIQSQMMSQQSQMIAQQGQMIGQLQAIASKPVPTFNPNIVIGGKPVAMNMMSEIDKQTKRGKYGPYG